MEALARFVEYYNPRAPSRIRRSFGMIGAKYRTSLPGTFCRESRSSAKHEISELTKSREKLPRLLDRFVERDDGRSAQSTNASPTTPLAVKRRASSGSSTPTRRTPGAVKRGFPEGSQLLRAPANSHLFQPRLTKSREFSGRPTRGNSRSEGTRPVRSGLPPPPSRLPNLDREETRAGFPYSFRGFCRSRRTARRAHRATLSVPVSSLDFRGERLRRRLPSGCSVYATAATHGQRLHLYRESTLWATGYA